jgi:RHS repeat-associated protein
VSGTVSDRDAYDPYGKITASSGTIANPFGYADGYTDAATGLVQFGTRYYNPTIGLFTQEDPSGLSAGYLYVGDNPVNGTDPTGQCVLGLFGSGCDNPVHSFISNAGSCIAAAGLGLGGGLIGIGSGIYGIATAATGVGIAVGYVGIVFGTAAAGTGIAAIANGAC